MGLKLYPQKCVLGFPEVHYLSCVISAEGILPNPDKILAVKEFPTHTNIRAVREYLCLASYYRWFVPDFAKGAGLLHVDMSQCPIFVVEILSLTSPPVIAYPDFSKPFVEGSSSRTIRAS